MTAGKLGWIYWLLVGLVLLLALALRLGAVNNTIVDDPLRADAFDYYSYAANMKYHHIYSRTHYTEDGAPKPDAYRTPGYPALLVPLISYPPDSAMILRITRVQALLDCLTVLLALAVFRQFMAPGWALGATLLTALSPHLISMTTFMLSETLFTLLTILATWLLMRARTNGLRTLAALAGCVIAAAALTRPTLQYFIVPAAALLLLQGNFRAQLRLVLPFVLGFALVFTPWTIRNIVQTGTMADPTLTINAYHHGMYPDFRYQDRPETTGMPYRFNPRNAEFSTDKSAVLHEIARRFREEPARHLKWYLFGKPVSLLSWSVLTGMGDVFVFPVKASPFLSQKDYLAVLSIMKALHWPLVILAVVASILVWLPAFARRISMNALFSLRLLSLLMLYFIALHMVAAPFPRYGIPLRPYIYGMALFLLSRLASAWLDTREPASALASES